MLLIDRISAAYEKTQVLSDVTLAVGEGEAVALLGRHGAGKTTLLKNTMGLHPTNGGRVIFEGRGLRRLPAYARARLGIAYVPQGRGIFPPPDGGGKPGYRARRHPRPSSTLRCDPRPGL